MKITDYALIFIGITLPIILISYINIALTIRTFQQEMYYQKVIDGAVEDTLSEMKRIESDEITNDYGYSGLQDNKISINPQVAVSTFFNSLYNSLDLHGDYATQEIVQLYVPVLAIMDYNGVYISSVEEMPDGTTKHVLKPKRYYTLTYTIVGENVYILEDNKWVIYELKDGVRTESRTEYTGDVTLKHTVELTTDDRIFHTYEYVRNGEKQIKSKEFYIDDVKNNGSLNVVFGDMQSEKAKNTIIQMLKNEKQRIMIDVVTEELVYATNKNNEYAHRKGIAYNFAFTIESNDEMYNYIKNVGVLALVQGIKVGNKYLNYKAYNMSDLELTRKYYVSDVSSSYYSKLYHKTKECTEYTVPSTSISQTFYYTREGAAENGYYPCPVCNP